MTETRTLSDYGVINIDFLIPEAVLPKNEVIFESLDWQDGIQPFLEQNKRTHPNDRLWITNNPKTGYHQIRREL